MLQGRPLEVVKIVFYLAVAYFVFRGTAATFEDRPEIAAAVALGLGFFAFWLAENARR